MSEAAWNKAFTQGSRALQDRLKKVHASNPKFQTWMQKSGHATDTSVKQASKEVKPSARVKSLQTKSLQAYGATKGAKVGGEHGSGEMKDTIAPLTRDQHSKVQAAERAAKAATKVAAPAKPKKPLSQAERMAVIRKAATKAKSKERFDVPTVNPDDIDHDDLRDVHQSLHVSRSYNEEFELDEVTKQEAEKMLGGPVKTRTGSEPKGKLPLGFRRARNLARKAMKTVKESTTEVLEVNEMNHGKKLAKAIMAKQSQHPIAQHMGEAIKDAADVGEYDYEGDMAKSQLRSILTNAKRLHDMLEDTTNLPEWVQSKITLAEDYILTAANYMEGEMNEETLAALEAELVEEIELFEKAPPGSKYERMVKHIKKGYAKGGLTPQEKSIAYATAWKAYGKKEEVEQTDEAVRIVDIEKKGKLPKKQDVRNRLALAARERRKITGGSGVKGFNKPIGFSPTKYMDTSYVRAMKKEEVEQVTEAEGKLAVTPKEKDLAAHHGDPKRITYGDVIKARLKSAAAKKMGKQ